MLATADGPDGEAVATTLGLRLPGADGEGSAVEWSEIESASWDGDESRLDLMLVADAVGRRQRHRIVLEAPGRLVDVVREQVTASVVISRHVPVATGRGVRVTGRRTPRGELSWSAQLDRGVDLDDPDTRARVDAAVEAVRNEVE